MEKHADLHLTIITDEEIARRHMGYHYLVTSPFATAHCAFRTRGAFEKWLEITGLKMGESLYWPGTFELSGQFFANCTFHIDQENVTFVGVVPWLSNGDYTDGFIQETPEGRVIHYLNPNVHTRKVYNYFAVDPIYG